MSIIMAMIGGAVGALLLLLAGEGVFRYYDPNAPNPRTEKWPILTATAGLMICGLILRLATLCINGAISPYYYQKALDIPVDTPLMAFLVKKGTLESLYFCGIVALILVWIMLAFGRKACTLAMVGRNILWISAATLGAWTLGGSLFGSLAIYLPEEIYRLIFFRNYLGNLSGGLVNYAWVQGSTIGFFGGGFLSLIIGLATLLAECINDLRQTTI
jgi:hypothetical protein